MSQLSTSSSANCKNVYVICKGSRSCVDLFNSFENAIAEQQTSSTIVTETVVQSRQNMMTNYMQDMHAIGSSRISPYENRGGPNSGLGNQRDNYVQRARRGFQNRANHGDMPFSYSRRGAFDRSRQHRGGYVNQRSVLNFIKYPMLGDYMVLGDSILTRAIKLNKIYADKYQSLCFGGATIQSLLERVNDFDFQCRRCVIMIGTNDVLQDCGLSNMKLNFSALIDKLLSIMDKIVLLTIPPITKVESRRVSHCNAIVKEMCLKSRKIDLVDVYHHFVNRHGNAHADLFEKYYANSQVDFVHPNRHGLCRILGILKKHCAVKRTAEVSDLIHL